MAKNNEVEFIKSTYKIADIKVGMILRKDWIVETQSRDYLYPFDDIPDIIIGVDDDYIENKHSQYPALSLKDCEYMWTGEQFFNGLIDFEGFMLHSSAVVYEGKAYLFSAPSGTGKSTHTELWQKVFGKENTFILNDDKPVIRVNDGTCIVYGTPWSGKTDKNKNVGVPLQGMCFLERSDENWIKKLDKKTAIFKILNQTLRPQGTERMDKLLNMLDKILNEVSVYNMGCNISEEAVYMAYNKMSK